MASATSYRPSAPPSYSPFPPTTTTVKQSPTHLLAAAAAAQGKKRTMSIAQTYYLAHKARAKLAYEAARADHDLRLLVGHANLLDSLMFELADAEREQESWFNQSVRGAARHEEPQPVPAPATVTVTVAASPAVTPTAEKKDRRVQWPDTARKPQLLQQQAWRAEDSEDDSELYDDSDYDSDDDLDMVETVTVARPVALRPMTTTSTIPISPIMQSRPLLAVEEDEDEDMDEADDDLDDYPHLELARTASHPHSPPELDADLSESSDEDSSMPPSPPNVSFSFPAKDPKAEIQQEEQEQDDRSSLYSEGFYIPRRNPTSLVSAISVY
ncbi:hypothetical protein ACRALDRAFT_1065881 [Sodiomyces alcalophilus JCM 7366]|uniref:uncharacterized protein n=1 Tax=Sodiomyces alcalophilus JCM 7366 TaxID=591952 RepID=UPI0039B46617